MLSALWNGRPLTRLWEWKQETYFPPFQSLYWKMQSLSSILLFLPFSSFGSGEGKRDGEGHLRGSLPPPAITQVYSQPLIKRD